MKHKKSNHSGFIAGLVILAIIALCMICWVVYSMGSSKHNTQKQTLAKGYQLFNSGKIEDALKTFDKAQAFFGLPLTLYRTVNKSKSDEFITSNDISIVVFSACITKAYDTFFNISPADKWLAMAKTALSNLKESKEQKELQISFETAKSVSKICSLYQKKDFEQALKDLYKIEQNVSENDKDFFIFEIRLMIACGKQINSNILLARARELLFFLAYDLKVEDPRIKILWAYLSAK